MKRSRELRGLLLSEVVAQTRLPARIVSALEEDDTSALPDRAKALQYVRAVALAIGLDPEEVALRYEEWLALLPPATMPPPPARAQTAGGKLWLRAAALGGIPRRLSGDPLVWLIIALTLVACAALLLHK